MKRAKVPVDDRIVYTDAQIKRLRVELCNMMTERTRLRQRVVAATLAGKYEPDELDVDNEVWDCDSSPTGRCVYGPDDPGDHDECLFCRKPEERK